MVTSKLTFGNRQICREFSPQATLPTIQSNKLVQLWVKASLLLLNLTVTFDDRITQNRKKGLYNQKPNLKRRHIMYDANELHIEKLFNEVYDITAVSYTHLPAH